MTHSTDFWSSAEAADDDHWFLGTLAAVEAPASRTGGALSVRTSAITLPGGFEAFVVELVGPAGAHGLPPVLEMPDMATMLEIQARHDIEVVGPPRPRRPGRVTGGA